jgi:hypothetical protein
MDRLRKVFGAVGLVTILGVAGAMGVRAWRNRDVEPPIERQVSIVIDGREMIVPDYYFGTDKNGKQTYKCSQDARWTATYLGVQGNYARCNAWDRPTQDQPIDYGSSLGSALSNSSIFPTGTILGVRVEDENHAPLNQTHGFTHNGNILQSSKGYVTVNGVQVRTPALRHTLGNEFRVDHIEPDGRLENVPNMRVVSGYKPK